ncbi:MAG: hypothetical protein C0441_09995, partial [Comamonadaceae bacterium]|nr:hypothetical protein [Comamonadaceae bacterium]
LEQQLAALGHELGAIKQARDELRGRLDALLKLEDYTRYADIDWMAPARQMAALAEERARLEAASDTLQELGRQLKAVQDRLGELDVKWRDTLGKQGEVRNKREVAQAMR